MIAKENITGLILAGGRGTRMGRVDKGLMPFRGGTLAQQVLQRLGSQVGGILINANQNLPAYQKLGAPVFADELGGFAGPLAGLQTGLRHCGTDYLVTAPCDSPFLPADLVGRLAEALQAQDADLALAVTLEADAAGKMYKQSHPVFCLLKTSVLPQLSAYLQEGGRRMDGWYGPIKVAEVLFDDASAFRNINTLDELRSLEAAPPRRTLAEVASCLSDYDPDALPVAHAQRIIRDFVTPLHSVEKVALRAALDRVLAADIVSPISVPAHDNSAMDGYALRGADLNADAAISLGIAGIAYAGRPFSGAVAAGQCVRIMTGAVMPDGCDSVIPQELVASASDSAITVPPGAIRAGDNRRLIGEDLMAGSAALKKGRIVRPADLGLLASLGIAEVPVQRRLRVAFFSTGDELRSIGEVLDPGCVYDSNRYTLFGMLTRLGCDMIDMGTVKDDPQALEAALRSGAENADAIITSGGVSVGAADYTRQIMGALGDVTFWKLGMRPGRPLAFGKIDSNGHSAFLFGLPGNPVAVMVSFYFFARDALLHMMGADAPLPLLKVRSRGAIRKKAGRTEFQRGILSHDEQGNAQVDITGAQGSGILRSMSQANCMVVLGDGQGNVAAGDMVEVLLFEGLV
ncbi:MAG TPA: gephyrin-like molybdotransferase Glp [Janthinobacterium sp.]|nr:gephyrin-like molybdotransferase Glp [Janthinobacterium sp.]